MFGAALDARAQRHAGPGQSSQSSQSSVLMRDYTVQSILSVLQSAGIKWTSDILEDDTPVVIADAFGVRMYIFPGSCAADLLRGCTDYYMVSVITAPPIDKDKLIKYNDESSFAFVAADAEGFTLTRYDFEQAGQSAVNFLASITLFRRDVLYFIDEFGFSSQSISELKRNQTDLMLSLRPKSAPGAAPDLTPPDQAPQKQNDLNHLLELVWDKEKSLGTAE